MGPEAWKEHLGEVAWNHLLGSPHQPPEYHEDLAKVLTRAVEAGWTPPTEKPIAIPRGRKVLWPSADGGMIPVLTGAGLAAHWATRGHGFLLLRASQLARGAAGPLLGALQRILNAYEEQCKADEVEPLPKYADYTCFVGGELQPTPSAEHMNLLLELIHRESPKPGKVERASTRSTP